MTVDWTTLATTTRILFTVPLRPLQGARFQPTGFPSLGPAVYETQEGTRLLVESTQSMANRLEATCWDFSKNEPIEVLRGISHVTVRRPDKSFLTDSMLEAHRLNSPYILENRDKTAQDFLAELKKKLGTLEKGPIDRALLARTLLEYDVGSLIHGVFLAKSDLAGGRLRVTRALSAFIDASGVRVAPAGGVKNDHVNPEGDTAKGFGNVPFSRDEFTAERIDLFVNLDLAQIRGYGLGEKVERMLVLLALHRVRKLLDGDLRLRTACDLEVVDREIVAERPRGFVLPALRALEDALREAIQSCKADMHHRTLVFADELKAAKPKKSATKEPTTQQSEPGDDAEDDT
ncbi:MAG: type I-U CRISPR-associated RAMP protein Csb1/Cas7u [Myxococcota bacterium]|nr:type I-U CRISPR-associated RAMP protein Csb1/Cas7u [Myxococcota bacterium]MDW8361705.1 type I-U CRISPR-associated RAMP protein Csb1/Cas7u [Myxococcales bacterium]